MADRLEALGFALDRAPLDERTAEGKPLGRPHLATAVLSHPHNRTRLTELGIAGADELFPAFLVPGAPAYVARERPTVAEAIDAIHEAGGVAVWAHPFWDLDDAQQTVATIAAFARRGLDGVECFYVTHTAEHTAILHAAATEHGCSPRAARTSTDPTTSASTRSGTSTSMGLSRTWGRSRGLNTVYNCRMPRVIPRALLTAAALLLALPASQAHATDYAEVARNIVPSGQYGTIPVPPGADEQAKMYDALTPLFDQVTNNDLLTTFKSQRFGVDDAGPGIVEATPRPGVTLTRDRFNVPHIVGKTHDDVTWAMGWVLQQDRGLLLAQSRYQGRIAALETPNLSAFSLVTGLKGFTPSKQADRMIVTNGIRAIRSAGKDGRALLHDVDVFIEGINARMTAEGSKEKPFRRADMFAINALLGQIFGEGGGGEARRAEFLSSLQKRVGARKAKPLFDDLSEFRDPDHPDTLTKPFATRACRPRRRATRRSTPGA
jgi:hypothetical protein